MTNKIKLLMGSVLTMTALSIGSNSYALSARNNLKIDDIPSNTKIAQQAEIVSSRYIYRVLDAQRSCVDLYAGQQIGANYFTDAWHSPSPNNPNLCKVRFTTQTSYQQNAGIGTNLGVINSNLGNTTIKNGNTASRIGTMRIPRGKACSQQQGTAHSILHDGYIYCRHNR